MTFRRSSAAVGLALVLAAGAAQAQQTTPGQPGGRRGAPRQELRQERNGGRMLRGITLSAAQQTQLRAINEKYAAQGKPLREAMRPAMQEARAARQRGDTVAARSALQRTSEQRKQMTALQERRLAEVRGILTADQQRQFDANRAELKARMEQRRANGDAGHKGGRRGWRGRAQG